MSTSPPSTAHGREGKPGEPLYERYKGDPRGVLRYGLATVGMVECEACLSWYHDTPEARFFHSRRCTG